jgi:peptidoglycan/xylan/chitin deacetylase (PgdA/CDA1 family)
MRISISLILILLEFSAPGQKKQVCFSFDDLPIVSYGMNDTCFQKKMFAKLILSLKTNKIPAIGFANGKKLFKNDSLIHFQYSLLDDWVDGGLDLGNHSFSHPDYNKVSFQAYSRDILKGEPVLKEILMSKGKSLQYFRHPFLHVGNNKTKADSLAQFLKTHGYIEAPVTIDNDDYLFALAYKRTKEKNDTDLAKQIGHDYVIYMEKKTWYFEKQAKNLFGRDINQILLLHSSLLNSDFVDSLAVMFRKNNYEFISMDKALKDKVYKTKVTSFGNWGLSWIDKWALSQGKKGDFFKDEPVTPDYIKKLSE